MCHRYQPDIRNLDRTTSVGRGLSCARAHESAAHTRSGVDAELAGVATIAPRASWTILKTRARLSKRSAGGR
jgi:hypothetical protein